MMDLERGGPVDAVCGRFVGHGSIAAWPAGARRVQAPEHLGQVCANDGWVFGTDTYAICGRRPMEGELETWPQVGLPLVDHLLSAEEFSRLAFRVPDELPRPRRCPVCGGRGGALAEVECSDCEGLGETSCAACGSMAACESCDGSGREERLQRCRACNAVGYMYAGGASEASVLGVRVPMWHWWALAGVPGAQVAASPDDSGGRIYFRSGDAVYRGVIMGMRTEPMESEAPNVEWKA
jgi:hypothetical protein